MLHRSFIRALLLGLSLGPGATAADAAEESRLNRAIETLSGGDPVFGIFSGDFSLANARALARSELDFIFIDMEHTPFDLERLQTFLLGMTDRARDVEKGSTQMDVTPFVRIPNAGPDVTASVVKQVLDVGAFGIVFPYVETAQQAERAVAAMRYPQPREDAAPVPAGRRGASPGIAAWFWGTPDYLSRADTWPLDPRGELLAILQIESRRGVENIEEILDVPGVGAVFVGPYDLSISYGVPGSRSDAEIAAAIATVRDACRERGIPVGLTTNAGNVARYLDEGYDFVTVGYWNDAGISPGVAQALAAGREAAGR